MLLPYVISSRVRLARNLQGCRFPPVACSAERRTVLACVQAAVAKTTWFDKAAYLPIDRLSPLERRILAEEHLISALLLKQEKQRLAIIVSKPNFAILVNEEDHLRIQAIQPGMQLRKTWQTIKKIEHSLKEHLDFAHSAQDGYLTTCPSNAGTGMRASVMLFLPGLVMLKRFPAILRKIAAFGYTVRGLYGEGSPSQGYLLQISKRFPFREKETELLQRLEKTCRKIIAAEQRARLHLLVRHGAALGNYFQRERRNLALATQVKLTAGMQLLAALRLEIALRIEHGGLGASTGARKNRAQTLKKIDKLFMSIQPAHILQAGLCDPQMAHASKTAWSDQQPASEDVLRAKIMKQELGIKNEELKMRNK